MTAGGRTSSRLAGKHPGESSEWVVLTGQFWGIEMLARGIRELLIIIMVISIPWLLGRAIYRIVLVAFPDLNMDCSESAAAGAGLLLVLLAFLAYLISRGVQFLRRRRGNSALSSSKKSGLLRVFLTLIGTFFVAAMIDGLSTELAGAASGASCNRSPVDTSFVPVPPVVIPAPLPEIPELPDLAPIPDVQPVPGGLTRDGIARGAYACRIGFSNFFFTIKNDSECSTQDIGFGGARDCTYSYDQTTGAIRVENPVEAELQRSSLRYVPEGTTGSKPDRTGPGIEASGFSLSETAPPTDWCAFQNNTIQP
jgi:hypothetical protein